MSVFFNRHRGRWAYRFERDKRTHQGYCIHPETGAAARNKTEARRIEELLKGQLGRAPSAAITPPGTYPLAEAVAAWYPIAKRLDSWPLIKEYLRELVDWFGAERPLESIDYGLLQAYVTHALEQPIKVWRGGPVKPE